ncbi:hypothetical protein ACHAW6_009671 [Cyclotella cf. meneghiniana]
MSVDSSISVPTFAQEIKNKQQIYKNIMSSQDLALLKMSDPFLYFSIPAVKNAAFLNEDVNASTLKMLSREKYGGSFSKVKENQPFAVNRKSRVSFECHVDLIFEHMLNCVSENSDGNDESEETEDDLYLSLKV